MANSLDAVLEIRRQRQARDAAVADSISSGIQGGIDNFTKIATLRDNQRQTQINELLAVAKLRELPQESLIKRGQASDAIMKMVEAGVMSPQQAQTQLAQLNSLQTQSNLSKFLTSGSPDPVSGQPLGQTVGTGTPPPTQSAPLNQRLQPDLFTTQGKANVLGTVTDQTLKSASGLEREEQIKAKGQALAQSEKEREKELRGVEKGISGTKRFLEQFERSAEELSKEFPDFGKVGVGGKFERALISGLVALDEFPETKTLITEIKPIANQSARDIEGGRVTDADRQIYADALANTIARPSATNSRLVSNELKRMADKGGNIRPVLQEFAESDVEVMQLIVKQTLQGLSKEQKERILNE